MADEEALQLSADGRWRWDGRAWQPAGNGPVRSAPTSGAADPDLPSGAFSSWPPASWIGSGLDSDPGGSGPAPPPASAGAAGGRWDSAGWGFVEGASTGPEGGPDGLPGSLWTPDPEPPPLLSALRQRLPTRGHLLLAATSLLLLATAGIGLVAAHARAAHISAPPGRAAPPATPSAEPCAPPAAGASRSGGASESGNLWTAPPGRAQGSGGAVQAAASCSYQSMVMTDLPDLSNKIGAVTALCGRGDPAACRAALISADGTAAKFQADLQRDPAPSCRAAAGQRLSSALDTYRRGDRMSVQGIDARDQSMVGEGSQALGEGQTQLLEIGPLLTSSC